MNARAIRLAVAALGLAATSCAPPIAESPRWWQEPSNLRAEAAADAALAAAEAPLPPCDVHVTENEPVAPFDLVGLVEVQPRGPMPDPEATLEIARRQACAVGGDGLIVLYRAPRRAGGLRPPALRGGALPEPAFRAAVIRYR